MAAERLPSTPAAAGKDADMADYRPETPQQAATPGATPISKAIALLQHRSSATPRTIQGCTARTAELSARKAELASLLNQVRACCSYLNKMPVVQCVVVWPKHAIMDFARQPPSVLHLVVRGCHQAAYTSATECNNAGKAFHFKLGGSFARPAMLPFISCQQRC